MPKIKYNPDNKEFECKKGASLFEESEKAELSIPFGCNNGMCGTCLCSVKKGAGNLSPKTDQEKETLELFDAEENQRLACQCKILGDVELDN